MQNIALTIQTWYNAVGKPSWAPPVWVFAMAWAIIYPLIFLSFGYVYSMVFRRKWPWWIGILFTTNLIFNIIFAAGTVVIFSENQKVVDIAQYYWPSTLVVSVVLLTLPPMMLATWHRARWVALCQIPYFIWIVVATTLQFAITMSN